jgi:hypothetical protein
MSQSRVKRVAKMRVIESTMRIISHIIGKMTLKSVVPNRAELIVSIVRS